MQCNAMQYNAVQYIYNAESTRLVVFKSLDVRVSYLYPLEVVDRRSETQLQVGVKCKCGGSVCFLCKCGQEFP